MLSEKEIREMYEDVSDTTLLLLAINQKKSYTKHTCGRFLGLEQFSALLTRILLPKLRHVLSVCRISLFVFNNYEELNTRKALLWEGFLLMFFFFDFVISLFKIFLRDFAVA